MSSDQGARLCEKLGGREETQRALQYLAKSAEPEKLKEAAAVVVFGDPADVTAPQWAAKALKLSGAPVLIISGGAGSDGTGYLLQNARKHLSNGGADVEELGDGKFRLPQASCVQGEWQKPVVPPQHGFKVSPSGLDPERATEHLTEADIYLELVLHELRPDPNDVAIGVNEMPEAAGKKLRIVIENRSTHSGENAQFTEALLRPFLREFEMPKIISVKAPMLLLRGTLTLKKEKADVKKSEWLGGNAEVLSYAAPCPCLSELDPTTLSETLAAAAGEYKRLMNYNGEHLDVENDFPWETAKTFESNSVELAAFMQEAGGKGGCGTKK